MDIPGCSQSSSKSDQFENWSESRRLSGGDPDEVERFFRSAGQFLLKACMRPPDDTLVVYTQFVRLNLMPLSCALTYFQEIIEPETTAASAALTPSSTPSNRWQAAHNLHLSLERLFLKQFGHKLVHWASKFQAFTVMNPTTGRLWTSPADMLASYFQITAKLREKDGFRQADEWDRAFHLLNDFSPGYYHSSHWETLRPPLGQQLFDKMMEDAPCDGEANNRQTYKWLQANAETLFRRISEDMASQPPRARYVRPPGPPSQDEETPPSRESSHPTVMQIHVATPSPSTCSH